MKLTQEQQNALYSASFYENDVKTFNQCLVEISEFFITWAADGAFVGKFIGNKARELYDAYVSAMQANNLLGNQQGLSVDCVDFII